MTTRALEHPPRILPLYARALAPLVPGASRLPWVGGDGGEIPGLQLTLTRVRAEAARVREYRRVCGFPPGGQLPATYVHVLAFPLHLALMADGRFPFAAVGLVHIANRIAQQRPIGLEEPLELRVRATPLQAHPRGRSFALVSEARVADELVWRELSTMLRRGPRTGASATARGVSATGDGASATAEGAAGADALEPPSAPTSVEWRLPGDLGRRYAAVSGDRNPIHLHALSARALGFPRAITHGMWTKARCLAALEEAGSIRPSGAFSIDVRFRRPILLPAIVGYASAPVGEAIRFAVRDAAGAEEHLAGRVQPIDRVAGQLERQEHTS
jgi:acyl dehydratase